MYTNKKINIQTLQLLHRGQYSDIYLDREHYDKPVVIKIIHKDTCSIMCRYKLHRELEISKQITHHNIRKVYETAVIENRDALIMEYISGRTIYQGFISQRCTIIAVLNAAVAITRALNNLHTANIAHNCITPSNILVSDEDNEIKFIDFGYALSFKNRNESNFNPEISEDSVNYMSPEQTGKLSRAVDYRTDFYSLGALFYEMFAGVPPFSGESAEEIIHYHIAKDAESPHKVKPEIPRILSDIILKLLSKNAEDRYQSAFGIESDLLKVQKLFMNKSKFQKNTVHHFSLAQDDFYNKLNIPDKILGREKEITFLTELLNGITSDKQLVFSVIAGFSGVGKSSLVQQFKINIVDECSIFIEGKFDQIKSTIPYFAFIQAFDQIISRLLTKNDKEFSYWKNELLKAVGKNGQILIDVLSNLELIIGKQSPVPKVSPQEEQNRFHMTFSKFVGTMTKHEKPLVVFLDDLQWADTASLKLLKTLITSPGINNALIIGAYRDNEVDESSQLLRIFDEIELNNIEIRRITLKGLASPTVNELLKQTFRYSQEKISELASIIYGHSYGNPFLIKQFLNALYDSKLVQFDPVSKAWNWDIAKIENEGSLRTAEKLVKQKIQDLNGETKQVLKHAAGIGNMFELQTLLNICKQSAGNTLQILLDAVEEGLIVRVENVVSFTHQNKDTQYNLKFKFTHDRIQKEFYNLIGKSQRGRLHLNIGRCMWENTSPGEIDNKIFEITRQINAGFQFIKSEKEKKSFAHLNLKAGKKALSSTAYRAALNHLECSVMLLPENSWEQEYELSYAIQMKFCEALYLTHNYEKAYKNMDYIIENSRTLLDKVTIYQLKTEYLIAQGNYKEALDIALFLLEMLGDPLAKDIHDPLFKRDRDTVRKIVQNTKIAKLLDLPQLKDEKQLAVLRTLSQAYSASYIVKPEIFIILLTKLILISLEHGNSEYSACAYVTFGSYTAGIYGDIPSGSEFIELGRKLAEKLPSNVNSSHGPVYFCYAAGCYINKPFKSAQKYYELSQYYCEQNGSFQWWGYTYPYQLFTMLFSGVALNDIIKKSKKMKTDLKKLNQPETMKWFLMWMQIIDNLRGESVEPTVLEGQYFKENTIIPKWVEKNEVLALGHFAAGKLMVCYLFNNFSEGMNIIRKYENIAASLMGNSTMMIFRFFHALINIKKYGDDTHDNGPFLLEKIVEIQTFFREFARSAPSNFKFIYLLITAELARIKESEDHVAVMQLYDQAIESAKESGILFGMALCCECAAQYYTSKNFTRIAQAYFHNTVDSYKQWGMNTKNLQSSFNISQRYHDTEHFIRNEISNPDV